MAYRGMAYRVPDFNFPEDFYLDDVGVWRLKKEKIAELENPGPQTNEEWLRSCDTEHLAWMIALFVGNAIAKHDCGNDEDVTPIKWMEWLKQPHKE